MAIKQTTVYTVVGVFVAIGIAALVGLLMLIGADTFGRSFVLIETYLDESVQGLTKGSNVLHRGVVIGRVEDITFVPAVYPMAIDSPEYKQFSRYVLVLMAIDPKGFPGLSENLSMLSAALRQQIAQGLRFKLSYQGITGICYIEADYVDPQRNPELQVPWVPKHPYVPSAPSLFTSFTSAVEKVFVRLERIDFEGLFKQTKETLSEIQKAVQDARIETIRQNAEQMMSEIRAAMEQVQQILDPAFKNQPGNLPSALADFSAAAQRINILLDSHQTDIDALLANLNALVDNLRQLSDQLKDSPSRLFFSTPPRSPEYVK